MRLTRGWRITLLAVAVALAASTPFLWLLDNPDPGQLIAASIQAATGIAALVWSLLFQSQPAGHPEPTDTAVGTGKAKATSGGRASTGIRRRSAGIGPARAERTGDATADGPDSEASTGIDYS